LDSFPEEQPFERDGRWWFKRGQELLLYDERTGQWGAAPPGAFGGAGTSAAAPITEFQSVAESTAQHGAAEAGSGFWKCTSCGSVNGTTATSCRMCFAPRP